MRSRRLVQAFFDCLDSLREATDNYDRLDDLDFRNRWRVSKQIVAQLAVMCLNRGRNHKSLVTQMGMAGFMNIPSFASQEVLPGLSMLEIFCHQKGVCFRGLKSVANQPKVCFSVWPNESIYGCFNNILSRKDIIWTIRDKEGVAHFDDKVLSGSAYSALLSDGHPNAHFKKTVNKNTVAIIVDEMRFFVARDMPPANSPPPKLLPRCYPISGAIDACVRTMATEILFALDKINIEN